MEKGLGLLLSILISNIISAQTICSQNGKVYGSNKITAKLLLKRLLKAKCDIYALQEIYGEDRLVAFINLKNIAKFLSRKLKIKYKFYLGNNSKQIYPAFIINTNLEILKIYSLDNKLKRTNKLFVAPVASRNPLILKIKINEKIITIVNIHFKSRTGNDSSGLKHEWQRVLEADKIFTYLNKTNDYKIIVGDRNSEKDSASNQVLLGNLTINNFNNCVILKDLTTDCNKINNSFFSALDSLPNQGSLLFKGKYYWFDDILLSNNFDELYFKPFIYYRYRGSDHALVGVRLLFH